MPLSERDYMRDTERDATASEAGSSKVPPWRRYWRVYAFLALVLVPGAIGGAALVITAMLCVIALLLAGRAALWFVRWLMDGAP
jgi:hypothetical protein